MDKKKANYQKKYRQDYKTKTKRVNLTFQNDEYRPFSRAADRQGKKVTPYIKELALNGLEQQASIPASLEEELKVLRFAVRNIANNVNQIAHYSNTIRAITTADENNLFQYLKQLEEVIRKYAEGQILNGQKDDC